ncbi:MAG: DNA repair protein RecO [Firmicutes bacterium ADurb.Bin456]|nr:MAG: DNA repair protein RecO [Firmicutes bacterium ADurb.Bin456]
MELVDALTPEGEPGEPLYLLLLTTLRLMAAEDLELLARAFEIKAADYAGYHPILENCANCQGSLDGPLGFNPGLGGVLCGACGAAGTANLPCSRGLVEILKVLRRWHSSRLRQLKVDTQARTQLKYLLHEYLKYHLEQEFKSTTFLDRFKSIPAGINV